MVAPLNVHLRTDTPFLAIRRAEPEIAESARIESVVRSEAPSPLGEMEAGFDARVTAAARRSTVTIFWTDARLLDASAVQMVIRYGPSRTMAPAWVLPSHW